MGSHTFDAYNGMLELFGPPPLLVNGTILTLEHVMQRLEIIENKVASVELIENLDKKIHNQITQFGSKVGATLKGFKDKGPIVNERIDQNSSKIGKLEDIITNLGAAFSSVKYTPTTPTKVAKLMYVSKNKVESSSKENADLKSISVHPNCLSIIKEPFASNEFLDFFPRSLIIAKNKETPTNYKCFIEELSAKDGTT